MQHHAHASSPSAGAASPATGVPPRSFPGPRPLTDAPGSSAVALALLPLGAHDLSPWAVAVMGAILLLVFLRGLWQRRQERAHPGPFLVIPPRYDSHRALEPAVPAPKPVRPTPRIPEPVGPRPAPPIDPSSETIQINPGRVDPGLSGTIQLLPGRLEILSGTEQGREFHFVRLPDQTVPEITIGRAGGPTYRHLCIAAPTVSRMHARLRFEDHRWKIQNLSNTNPVRVNDHELQNERQDVELTDGDLIRLGDVELRYRMERR